MPCHLSANLGNIQSCSPAKEMTTFVKLYVQGESSKMPVVYDRFGTNGLTVQQNIYNILKFAALQFKRLARSVK